MAATLCASTQQVNTAQNTILRKLCLTSQLMHQSAASITRSERAFLLVKAKTGALKLILHLSATNYQGKIKKSLQSALSTLAGSWQKERRTSELGTCIQSFHQYVRHPLGAGRLGCPCHTKQEKEEAYWHTVHSSGNHSL